MSFLNRIKPFFAAWLIAASASFLACPADAGMVQVGLLSFAPLQTDGGKASAHEKAQEMIDEATRNAEARGGGDTVKAELIKILNREARLGMNGYISPDGMIRPVDGHHKILAIAEVMQNYGIDPRQVDFSVNIKKDYSHKSWATFARDMQEKNLGYFSPEVLRASQRRGESLGDLYEHGLPRDFESLRDSPMRSAVGRLFDSLGIKGSSFRPYIQFLLGDQLASYGVRVAPGEEFDDGAQARIIDQLFFGPHHAEMQNTLISNALPEQRAAIRSELVKTVKRLATQRDLNDGQLNVACMRNALQRAVQGAAENALPALIPLPTEPEAYQSLLNRASGDFIDQTDLKGVGKRVNALVDTKKPKFAGPDKKLLKATRKKALALRSAYRLLTNDRWMPPSFKDFTKDLGELNDEISKWDMKKKPSDALVKLAKKIQKDLAKSKSFTRGYESASAEGFLAIQRANLENLKRWVNNPRLTVDEYHDIRKSIRDYMYLFDLLNNETPKQEYASVQGFLAVLSKRMGGIKDGLLNNDDGKPHGDEPTQIDPDSRRELLDFVALIERSLGN
jgi:hypothetical protein